MYQIGMLIGDILIYAIQITVPKMETGCGSMTTVRNIHTQPIVLFYHADKKLNNGIWCTYKCGYN